MKRIQYILLSLFILACFGGEGILSAQTTCSGEQDFSEKYETEYAVISALQRWLA